MQTEKHIEGQRDAEGRYWVFYLVVCLKIKHVLEIDIEA